MERLILNDLLKWKNSKHRKPLILKGVRQVGDIGADLPRDDTQITTQAGDIVLYSGDQLVVFYGSNSWAYTRLGRITDRDGDGMGALLGGGDVTVTLTAG